MTVFDGTAASSTRPAIEALLAHLASREDLRPVRLNVAPFVRHVRSSRTTCPVSKTSEDPLTINNFPASSQNTFLDVADMQRTLAPLVRSFYILFSRF